MTKGVVMDHALNEPTPLWCICDKPLPVHIAERKGAARSVCARCERPLQLRLSGS
jgi:hypothetical protein